MNILTITIGVKIPETLRFELPLVYSTLIITKIILKTVSKMNISYVMIVG